MPHQANEGVLGNDAMDNRKLNALLRSSIPAMWVSEEDTLLSCVNPSFGEWQVNGYHSGLQSFCSRDII